MCGAVWSRAVLSLRPDASGLHLIDGADGFFFDGGFCREKRRGADGILQSGRSGKQAGTSGNSIKQTQLFQPHQNCNPYRHCKTYATQNNRKKQNCNSTRVWSHLCIYRGIWLYKSFFPSLSPPPPPTCS